MTLEERENLLILFKDKFERAFIELIDDDLINLEETEFISTVLPCTPKNYGNNDYNTLTEDWVSFRIDFKKRYYEKTFYLSYCEDETSLLPRDNKDFKFRYGFLAEIIFNKEFDYEDEDLPWYEAYDDIFIEPIEKLKILLNHDDDSFKDYQLKLINDGSDSLFHILIFNTKDIYEFLPLQWKLVDKVNP